MVPSIDSEGLPTTILEAMAAGRVVVATDVGGATEAIRDGVDGMIVQPRDAAALASALEILGMERSFCNGLTKSARRRVLKHFSMSVMLDRVCGSYRQLSEEKSHD